MVDWSLARQVARVAAGRPSGTGDLRAELQRASSLSEAQVSAYTGLALASPAPPPEPLERAGWAEVNLDAFASLLGPVADRLAGRLSSAGALAGPLQAAAGATLAAEVGLVTGYLSHRVLGQYEISLLQPHAPTRLLFVAPNVEGAIRELELDRDSFIGWIALHEMTHVFEFSGVPWLREHLSGLVREYLQTVEVRIERGAAGGLPTLPDPARIVEAFREGGLIALVQTREQRRLMSRMQATMAVVEGYSEHVMDAVGADVLPSYEGLREAMDRRRRSRSAPERILQRLLGLDLKLRQYSLGKRFCDRVVELAGIEGLNRVWDGPEALPNLSELDRPDRWLARVGGEHAAVAQA